MYEIMDFWKSLIIYKKLLPGIFYIFDLYVHHVHPFFLFNKKNKEDYNKARRHFKTNVINHCQKMIPLPSF